MASDDKPKFRLPFSVRKHSTPNGNPWWEVHDRLQVRIGSFPTDRYAGLICDLLTSVYSNQPLASSQITSEGLHIIFPEVPDYRGQLAIAVADTNQTVDEFIEELEAAGDKRNFESECIPFYNLGRVVHDKKSRLQQAISEAQEELSVIESNEQRINDQNQFEGREKRPIVLQEDEAEESAASANDDGAPEEGDIPF